MSYIIFPFKIRLVKENNNEEEIIIVYYLFKFMH